ncbi:hypothetical protein B484DRAFT_5215 [Ochromonadaceae sp. CCMP2298]|nr:hypothetical protein B484DRAFT_5215 [Ochromonadaceae sp. CCMP2298]
MSMLCSHVRYLLSPRHAQILSSPDEELQGREVVLHSQLLVRHSGQRIAEPPGHQSELGVAHGAKVLPNSVQHEGRLHRAGYENVQLLLLCCCCYCCAVVSALCLHCAGTGRRGHDGANLEELCSFSQAEGSKLNRERYTLLHLTAYTPPLQSTHSARCRGKQQETQREVAVQDLNVSAGCGRKCR